MARLDDVDILAHQRWLTAWRTPEAVLLYVGQVNECMGAEDFFYDPKAGFLRDAKTGAMFAKARGAPEVRLIAEEWPDIEVRIDHLVERLECVEADLPGRKRNLEYRNAARTNAPFGLHIQMDEDGQAEAERDQVPIALRNAAAKKAAKSYVAGASLLILLNVYSRSWSPPGERDPLSGCFAECTEIAAGKFVRIWVLWEGVPYGPYHEVTPPAT